MEALALLCTLHADGPSTLLRLRRGGCNSLRSVEAMPAEELAQLVGINPSTARRFIREAAGLRQRLAPGEEAPPLDAEEVPEFLEVGAQQAPLATQLNQGDLQAKKNMLAVSIAEAETCASDESFIEEEIEMISSLQSGDVDGLDQGLIDVLAAEGVMSLWDLGHLEAGALARSTGVAYSRLTRLGFLARRENPEPPVAAQEIEVAMPLESVSELTEVTEPEPLEEAFEIDPEEICLIHESVPAEAAVPVFVPPTAYEQPVPIQGDPSQRPPFWEARTPRREEAQPEVQAESFESGSFESAPMQPSPMHEPDLSPESPGDPQEEPSRKDNSPEGTTLGWDFQVPTPPGYTAPASYPPVHLPQAALPRVDRVSPEQQSPDPQPNPATSLSEGSEEGVGGPFA